MLIEADFDFPAILCISYFNAILHMYALLQAQVGWLSPEGRVWGRDGTGSC